MRIKLDTNNIAIRNGMWFLRFSCSLNCYKLPLLPLFTVSVAKRIIRDVSSLLWRNVKGFLGKITAWGSKTGPHLKPPRAMEPWLKGVLFSSHGLVCPPTTLWIPHKGINRQLKAFSSFLQGNLSGGNCCVWVYAQNWPAQHRSFGATG